MLLITSAASSFSGCPPSGSTMPPSPSTPWTRGSLTNAPSSGRSAPEKPAPRTAPDFTNARVFARVRSSPNTLPPATVMARTSNFGRGEREQDRDRIVGAGIAVQNADRRRHRCPPSAGLCHDGSHLRVEPAPGPPTSLPTPHAVRHAGAHDRRVRQPRRPPRRIRARMVLARSGTDDPRVEAAFAKVPREVFVGPPPWSVGNDGSWVATSDPERLYRDDLVALDRAKRINNGQPSLHARCIAALRLSSLDHVVHIGAGTGYYTAILAELSGAVEGAYEREPALAAMAVENLRPWPAVTVHAETATGRGLSRRRTRDLCQRRCFTSRSVLARGVAPRRAVTVSANRRTELGRHAAG